jgi:Spy/CpxP family protein refolding chaperone
MLRVALFLGLVACGGKDAPKVPPAQLPQPPVPGAERPGAPAPTPPSKPQHHALRGSPAMMLFQAAHNLELKDDQKAKVDASMKSARPDMAGAADTMKAMHADMIAGVKAGKLDDKKMEGHWTAVDKARKAHEDKADEALNALHAALDAGQRKQVVAAVRDAMSKRPGRPGGPPGDMSKMRVERLTKELGLDAAQQKKVEAIVPKQEPAPGREEMKKQVDALLGAFEADGFDARKIEGYDSKRVKAHMDAEMKFIAALLPILKPEQREKLAQMMDKKPGRHARPPMRAHHRDDDDDTDD